MHMPRALGVIGAGNMAEAIVRGALGRGILSADELLVSDPAPRRRAVFAELGVQAVPDNAMVAQCRRLLLAVKPQTMPAVLEELASRIDAQAPVISIAAGIRTDFIHQKLGGRGRVVRVMPNTPMLVGAGVSAICGGPGATREELEWAERLFGACGQTIRVDETQMDAVTAVSGSGPAYFFYLIEAMIAAGVAEGLSALAARELAVQTCRGAAELLIRSGDDPAALRQRVTSPKGTTQAAIEAMDAAGLKEALIAAVRRAAARSRELGR
jgi:pyrroline-5-carboxylate reductase